MSTASIRNQTPNVKYAKGMTPGFDKEGNKFLSRQFKPNSTEIGGSHLIDRRRNVIQNVEVGEGSGGHRLQGVGELRMSKEADGIIPRLFATDDINLREGAHFGSFRPTFQDSEGGYRMTFDEEIKCKMAVPYQVSSPAITHSPTDGAVAHLLQWTLKCPRTSECTFTPTINNYDSFLDGVVAEKLLNEINVREEHPPAAVPPQVQAVQRVSFGIVSLQDAQVSVPFVADHFAAGEAAHGDDHVRPFLQASVSFSFAFGKRREIT